MNFPFLDVPNYDVKIAFEKIAKETLNIVSVKFIKVILKTDCST